MMDIEPTTESLMTAAQCWGDKETSHIEMNSALAVAFAKRLDDAKSIRECAAKTPTNVGQAMTVIKQEMIDDNPADPGSYAHVWHCNIAMMCYDAITKKLLDMPKGRGLDHDDIHAVSNDAASRFMRLCFDVETKS